MDKFCLSLQRENQRSDEKKNRRSFFAWKIRTRKWRKLPEVIFDGVFFVQNIFCASFNTKRSKMYSCMWMCHVIKMFLSISRSHIRVWPAKEKKIYSQRWCHPIFIFCVAVFLGGFPQHLQVAVLCSTVVTVGHDSQDISSFLFQRCGKRSAAIPRTLFPSLKVSHGIDIFFFPGAESGQQEHIFWPGFCRYLIVILISYYLHWMMRNVAHYSPSSRKAGSLH